MVILNFGGEGERPEAIDINTLLPGAMNRAPSVFIRPGWLIQGDFCTLPIRSSVADEVWGHMVPLFLSRRHDHLLANEAFRVLRSGGRVRISPSLPAELLLPALMAAGFVAVTIEGGYATGVKP